MKVFFLTVFLTASLIHLTASVKHNNKVRACSKVFLLSSLLGWYCFAASAPRTVVTLALAFSWLGDVLLIPKGLKWFVPGGVSFLLSHLFFVQAYRADVLFSAISPAVILLSALVYAAAVLLIFKALKPHLPKLLFFPMLSYLLVNGAMNCFALYRLLSCKTPASAVTFIGALLFFCSDAILFFTRFNKNTRFKSHFAVMLSYLSGEFLITRGLI